MSEAFEEIMAVLLESDGYWLKRNVKIQLPAPTAASLGLKSGACELDLVAFNATEPQEVLIVECKSYGRSGGVDWRTFKAPTPPITRRHRYRLFWNKPLQAGITALLQSSGITPAVPHVYCLASAATIQTSHAKIQAHLHAGGMRFFDRAWVSQKLLALGTSPVYQNCTVSSLASFHHPASGRYA